MFKSLKPLMFLWQSFQTTVLMGPKGAIFRTCTGVLNHIHRYIQAYSQLGPAMRSITEKEAQETLNRMKLDG